MRDDRAFNCMQNVLNILWYVFSKVSEEMYPVERVLAHLSVTVVDPLGELVEQ